MISVDACLAGSCENHFYDMVITDHAQLNISNTTFLFFNSYSAMRAESKYCRIDHSEQVLPMLAKHHFARYEFLLD